MFYLQILLVVLFILIYIENRLVPVLWAAARPTVLICDVIVRLALVYIEKRICCGVNVVNPDLSAKCRYLQHVDWGGRTYFSCGRLCCFYCHAPGLGRDRHFLRSVGRSTEDNGGVFHGKQEAQNSASRDFSARFVPLRFRSFRDTCRDLFSWLSIFDARNWCCSWSSSRRVALRALTLPTEDRQCLRGRSSTCRSNPHVIK